MTTKRRATVLHVITDIEGMDGSFAIQMLLLQYLEYRADYPHRINAIRRVLNAYEYIDEHLSHMIYDAIPTGVNGITLVVESYAPTVALLKNLKTVLEVI